MVKNVRFDFVNSMGIGAIHIEADCETVEDFKEALKFADCKVYNKNVGKSWLLLMEDR